MVNYSLKFSNYEELKVFVDKNHINQEEQVLVQVFTSKTQKQFILQMIDYLLELMPKCKIIGTTAIAQMQEGNIYEDACTLEISVFHKTRVQTYQVESSASDYDKGVTLAHSLISFDTKLLISFIDMQMDGQAYLDGISSVNASIIVSGGVSSSAISEQQYIFTEQGICKDVVAATLNGEELYVNHTSCYDWVPIGKDHVITSVKGKRIQTIDGMNAVEFYKKYTGIKKEEDAQIVGIHFPLMMQRNGLYVSNPVTGFHENEELEVILKADVGEKIRMGYGDLGEILRGIERSNHKIDEFPLEAAFVYSCDSRKRFLDNMTCSCQEVYSNADFYFGGFYTLGEFNFENSKNMFMTETMNILILSENRDIRKDKSKKHLELLQTNNANSNINVALYNLIKTTGEELNELNNRLEYKVEEKTKELKEQYYKDELTKLYNRNKLLKDIEAKQIKIMAIFDIQAFSGINDFYGNENGNHVLGEFAGVVMEYAIKHEYTAYRVGGDIFAVTSLRGDLQEFTNKMQELQIKIQERYFLEQEYNITLNVFVGISKETDKILEKTEMALNYGKRMRSCFEVYDEKLKLKERIEENMVWIHRIKQAIATDRIVPYFQPIMNNQKTKVEKYEALIRMIGEDGTVISPVHFLDIAKKSGLYHELTRIMIEKSFRVLRQTQSEISVNLLLQDITNTVTREFIMKKLSEADNPQNVVFEIVEAEGIENFDEVSLFIQEVKKFGAKIAIDDFGTGYSNFRYLMKLNVDYIKIDGSLVENIHTDKSAEIIVKTIVNFAEELGIKTIAEYVSEEKVFEITKNMKVDYSQGYYISEPRPEL